MKSLTNLLRKLNLAALLAAALLPSFTSITARAAAFVIDDRNGVWGVAYSMEDRQVERAVDRAVRFGARNNLLTITTTTATRGYYVAYAIGYCGDTARWIGAYGFGRTPAAAQLKARNGVMAQGAGTPYVVKEWLDN